jgi:hypothetical protein
MRSVTTLLLLLLTANFLSCAHPNPKFGDEKKSECGEVPVGVTMDKSALDLAGANLGDFSLAKLNIQFTPELQRIISDAATNALVQDYISCKVIERAGVQKDPELVAYFMHLTYFLSKEPTAEEQTTWRQANPFPGKKGKPELSEKESTDRDDKKLFFECDYKPLPKTIPSGGLRAVLFDPHPPSVHSFHEIWEPGNPGDPNHLVKYGPGGAGFMCLVTYYGKSPILKVELTFALEFREVVGGNIKFVTTRPARIRKLEPNGKYDFYLFNASEHILNISLPKYAEVELLGEYQSRKVKLSTPYTYDGSFAVQMGPVKHPSSAAK